MSYFTFENIIKVSDCIMEFVLLNIMWFLCTVLGLVIFGWAPSTAALLSIVRDKIIKKDEADYNIIKQFFKIYKKEFIRTNILAIVIMLFYCISIINEMNFELQDGFIFRILTIASLIAKLIIYGAALYIFPLYVHYEMNLKDYLIKGLVLLCGRPFVTLCIVLWTGLVYAVISLVPGLIAICAVSVYAYGIMAINYQFYMRNEQRLKYASQK